VTTVGMLAQALVRWQHAAGPFWPYVCAAPFLGTGESAQLARLVADEGRAEIGRPSRTSRRHQEVLDHVLVTAEQIPLVPMRETGLGGGEQPDASRRDIGFPVILADLPAELMLAVAPRLASEGWYVVPVIQRWIASPAVLPCRQLLALLLVGAWQIRRPRAARGAILMADGDRLGPVGYPLLAAGRTFDNRYEYQICRFPSTRFLVEQGVRRVHWINCERPAPVPVAGLGSTLEPRTIGLPPVARDLHPYREALLQANIEVDVAQWPQA
jgi:hypothetical protein